MAKTLKYSELIGKMTLKEKASLCSGANFWNTKAVERLGIPSMMLTDGPHGLRKQAGKDDNLGLNNSVPATCYPTAAALACSWNEELLEEMGEHLGLETKSEKVSVVLGPGVNIKRSPLCGRNFEYFSEDPMLSGKCAAALIRGIQANGVSACVKHFAANSQELLRMSNDSVVDERTLREIYLPAFELAVKEGKVKCLMTSYNRLNGTYANENTHLLRDILFGDWGYKGMVVTDWGGNNDRVEAIKAGDSLEMPGTLGETDRLIVKAVEEGRLDENVLNEAVDRFLTLLFDCAEALKEERSFDKAAHHAFARKMAGDCAVLLKNEDNILPLDMTKTVAVIGDFAQTPRYQGAGSSCINPTFLDNGLEEMRTAGFKIAGFEPGFKRKGGADKELLERACALAAKADTVVLWLGLDEGSEAEGVDRPDMTMPENQIELLNAVKAVNANIVVVLSCGAPVVMNWDKNCKGLLHAYLGGQAGAGAVADILCGKVNPSGKLAETLPVSLERTPCHPYYPGKEASVEYREGIYVGYRYYSSAAVPVKYPFGFGLSYTRFEYSDMDADATHASLTVKNVGDRAGAETVQIYVAAKTDGVFRPALELRGFAKVFLKPGESKRVTVVLNNRSFAYWNVKTDCWEIEGGKYEILACASAEDIRLRDEIFLDGSGAENPYTAKVFAPYYKADVQHIPDDAFEALIGRKAPPRFFEKGAPLDFNSPVAQGAYQKGGVGRILYEAIELSRKGMLMLGKKELANSTMFIMNMPFRGISHMAGVLSEEQMKAFVKVANREKGALKELIKARKIGQ